VCVCVFMCVCVCMFACACACAHCVCDSAQTHAHVIRKFTFMFCYHRKSSMWHETAQQNAEPDLVDIVEIYLT
jgi:hypothetical protein